MSEREPTRMTSVDRVSRDEDRTGQRLRVLLADDSREVRRALVETLQAVSAVEVVAQAETATTAYRFAHDLRPDVIVLDINMPDRSGIWVLRQLRSEAVDSTVFMLSNHGSEFYRRKCLDAGADGFYDKHSEIRSLIDRLGDLAARRNRAA
ncbi:MAG: response regulator transcription factor [Bacteroidota bacterium]